MRRNRALRLAFLVFVLLCVFLCLSPARGVTPAVPAESPAETPEPTPAQPLSAEPAETPAPPAPAEESAPPAVTESAPPAPSGPQLREGGRLIFLGEDGEPVRDACVGELYFDADGFYTSGDAELDRAVEEILKSLREQQPDADRFTLLRSAYDYMLAHYQYVGGHVYPARSSGWEIDEARDMLTRGLGNCFGYAGGFWALARGLGYESVSRCRNIDPDYAHAWNDIAFDGVYYIFDPCLEQMKGNERFMLSYGDGAKYGYPLP